MDNAVNIKKLLKRLFQKYLTTKEHKGFSEGAQWFSFSNQMLCDP